MKSRREGIRRPKYLSLRHQLAPSAAAGMPSAGDHHKQPMTLFPLQPAADQESNVARLFTAADGGGATLAGLLPAAEEGSEEAAAASPSSASAYSCERGSSMVVRAALRRSREREDEGEEEEIRWVRMSEVVGGGRTAEEEVSSRAAAEGEETWWSAPARQGLSLKLDYKEVLEAWCDKERPFLGENEGEAPQTVPDLQLQHDFSFDQLNGGTSEHLWRVPSRHGKEENGELGQREASVLRYREKRMNRLFSKRIRYQVRKLNAEKRPRVKGRFVKRS